MRTISLRLDADSDALLRSLCERMGVTQTDVIRKALNALSKTVTPTPASLATELGLVGLYAGGGESDAAGHSAAVKARLELRQRNERSSPANAVTNTSKKSQRSCSPLGQ